MKRKPNRYKGPQYYDRIYSTSPRYRIKPHGVQPTYFTMLKFCKEPILEVGCGTGQFAQYAQDKVKYVLGIDFSKVGIDMARGRCPKLKFVHGNVLEHPEIFELDYNTVFMYEVLEHVEKDFILLDMIPGGKKIVFSVPNYDALGHVRYFESIQDVKDRYKLFIEFTEEAMQGTGKGRTIFLMGGVKK